MTPERKILTWNLLWHLICYAPKLYAMDSFFWILFMSLPGVTGLIIRAFFDKLADHSSFGFSLWGLIVLLVVTDLGHLAILFTCRCTKSQLRFTMSTLLQRNLLVPLLNRPGALPLMTSEEAVPTISSGEAISYFRDDADQIQDHIATISEVTGAGVLAFGALALLLHINARMTLLAFLPLAVMVVVVVQAQKHIKQYRQASRRATEQVTGLMGEMFRTVQAIKIAGAQNQVLSHFQQVNGQRRQLMVKDQLFTAVLKSAFENLYSIGTGLILLVAAQSMESDVNRLSIGDFALFVYYLPYVTYFLKFLGSFLTMAKQTEVSFDRMAVLLSGEETTPPIPHSQTSQQPNSPAAALVAHTPLFINDLLGHRPELPPVDQPRWGENTRLHELCANNLTYSYPSTGHGIRGANLMLRRGSLTVITGAIGSGKTTLLRVLLGLLPSQSGEIYWNGEKVNDPANFFVPPRSAYTPQVPELFSESLRNNLLLGLEPEERDIETALKMAVFEPDVAAMREGLETMVGARGMRLSGGQIQRAAAARMFVRQPELLAFDDLSSALDVETEQKLWSRLFASRCEHPETNWTPTYLVVSHRPWVLKRADLILILNEGRVQAQGKWEDLRDLIPSS